MRERERERERGREREKEREREREREKEIGSLKWLQFPGLQVYVCVCVLVCSPLGGLQGYVGTVAFSLGPVLTHTHQTTWSKTSGAGTHTERNTWWGALAHTLLRGWGGGEGERTASAHTASNWANVCVRASVCASVFICRCLVSVPVAFEDG